MNFFAVNEDYFKNDLPSIVYAKNVQNDDGEFAVLGAAKVYIGLGYSLSACVPVGRQIQGEQFFKDVGIAHVRIPAIGGEDRGVKIAVDKIKPCRDAVRRVIVILPSYDHLVTPHPISTDGFTRHVNRQLRDFKQGHCGWVGDFPAAL